MRSLARRRFCNFRAATVPVCGILMIALAAQAQEVRLLVRGDDLGMTQGSLVAFEKAFNEGVLTCGAMVVPGPWFEGAAELARRNPGWCIGVHLCLVGEWRGFRWRPVLPWDKVRSIVDSDGYLHTSPGELFAHQPKLEEIDAELRAQINLAVCHIGIDSPEQRALIHSEPKDIFVEGGVGRHRAEELSVVTSLEVRSAILKKGIILINYRELWKQRR